MVRQQMSSHVLCANRNICSSRNQSVWFSEDWKPGMPRDVSDMDAFQHITEKDLLTRFAAPIVSTGQWRPSRWVSCSRIDERESIHADIDVVNNHNDCDFKQLEKTRSIEANREECAWEKLRRALTIRKRTNPTTPLERLTSFWSSFQYYTMKYIPATRAARSYSWSDCGSDVLAGLAVGMSYALLAGLPPAHGLYNNIIFPLVYSFLGTSSQVTVGTSAIEAMLSSEAVANVVGRDAPHELWVKTSIELSLCVGVTMLCMNFLRLGLLSGFLADPVLGGFATGSAVTIAISQLHHVVGISLPKATAFETLRNVASRMGETNWASFIIAISGVFLLAMCRWISRRFCTRFPFPESLVLMIVFLGLGSILQLDQPPFNVPTVGTVPRGSPPFRLPSVNGLQKDSNLVLQALWYSAVHYVVHVSAAKVASTKVASSKASRFDPNQEFLALGTAGIVGSFFQCFPPATSFSRTCIACIAGSKTPFFNIINAGVVLLAAIIFAPFFECLPTASLAAVILFGVYWMMNFGEAYKLLLLRSPDALLWIVSFTVTLCFGAMEGLAASTVLSLLWLLKKNAWPTTAVLGRLPGTIVYRNIRRFPMAKEVPGIKIFRFDASLNFANAEFFRSKVSTLLQLSPSATPRATKENNWNPNGMEVGHQTNVFCTDEDLSATHVKRRNRPRDNGCFAPSQETDCSGTDDIIMASNSCKIPLSVTAPVLSRISHDTGKQEHFDCIHKENNAPSTNDQLSTVDEKVDLASDESSAVSNMENYPPPRPERLRLPVLCRQRSCQCAIQLGNADKVQTIAARQNGSCSNAVLSSEESQPSALEWTGCSDEKEPHATMAATATTASVSLNPEDPASIKALIIDASSINDMDVTSIGMMERLAARINARGCALLFANWKGPMRDFLERAKFYETVPPENCFLGLHDAVVWAESHYIGRSTVLSSPTPLAPIRATHLLPDDIDAEHSAFHGPRGFLVGECSGSHTYPVDCRRRTHHDDYLTPRHDCPLNHCSQCHLIAHWKRVTTATASFLTRRRECPLTSNFYDSDISCIHV